MSDEKESTNGRYYGVLKQIKKLADHSNRLSISSTELAGILGVSQQSASRFILNMIDEGYITRSMENRKQVLKITEQGLSLLYSELSDLLGVLGMESKVIVEGRVSSGMGEGRYYISRKDYIIQFQEKLGMIPFLGTLNIKVDPENWDSLRRLRTSSGILIDGFKTEDRTFGDVKAFYATIDGIKGAVIMPVRTVYTDVIEMISETYLREALSLEDGTQVKVEVDL